jgi:phosphatidylinositol-3-phosphatase
VNFLRGICLLFAISALSSCGGGSSLGTATTAGGTTGAPASGAGAVPQFAHVLVLVEENHGFGAVVGNSGMPYVNQLASQYGLATQYFADAHNSLLDYFMLTAGATIAQDDNYIGPATQDNVVRALKATGKSWKCYAESLPAAGYTGGDMGAYIKHHNPFAYFSDVLNDPAEAANIVPFSQFATDLANGGLPDYSFIVPNVNDDAHDCPAGLATCADSQKLIAADQWLQTNVDPFLKSSAFQNSLLIITFDEGDLSDNAHGGGQVVTLIISPKAKPGYQSTTFYQHESALRLTMEALGVSDLPGAAAGAPEMDEFFK